MLYFVISLFLSLRLPIPAQTTVPPSKPTPEVQALMTPDGKFLVQKFEIDYAYSATGAEAAWKEKEDKQRTKPTGTLLAFANPDFGDEKRFGDKSPINLLRPFDSPSRPLTEPARPITEPSRDIVTERGGGIVTLPGTQKEADALKIDFPGPPPSVLILTKKNAQKAAALK